MPFNVIAIGQVLVLVTLANGTPVIAKKVLGGRWSAPLDGGLILGDGRPLFGRSKTVRGVVLTVVATAAGSELMGLGWSFGAMVAAAAMAGDLLSSFIKRRAGMPSSSKATGIDQIPEALFPAVAAQPTLGLSAIDIGLVALIFLVGEILVSRVLFRLKIRDQPY